MITPAERTNDDLETLKTALVGMQAGIWTSVQGIVVAIGTLGDQQTVTMQPATQAVVQDKQGVSRFVNLPLLPDVPVLIVGGGGYSMTMPIKVGDEGLVFIASRNIDNWWQSGGVQPPFDGRMHDLSDGFVLVGPRSQRRLIPNYSLDVAQLRSDDGTVSVTLDVEQGIVTHTAPNLILLDTPLTVCTGAILAQGMGAPGSVMTIDGALHATGKISTDQDFASPNVPSYEDHTHDDAGGSGVSGKPTVGS